MRGSIHKLVTACLIVSLCFGGTETSQCAETSEQFSASVDTTQILIGDHVTLTLQATVNVGERFYWPLFFDTVGQLELVEAFEIDTILQGEKQAFRQNLIVSAYDSGYYRLSSIPLYRVGERADSMLIAKTSPIFISVATLAVDTAASSVKPIKAQLDAPLTFREVLPWLVALIVLLALIIAAIWFWKTRKKEDRAIIKQVRKLPAHIIALKKLDALKEEKLWQQEHTKKYYVSLSEIVREYLELRYEVPALESTTDEIVSSLQSEHVHSGVLNLIRSTLELADLAKFAKLKPLPDENIKALDQAYELVKMTRKTEAISESLNSKSPQKVTG